MKEQAVRCIVSGRVQGVWYRVTTARQAEQLSLRGSARNLADGAVEVIAAGDPEAIARLSAWLWDGPSGARVTGVEVQECNDPVAPGFRIL
ncbi:MAG: acylphosphatase [Gammaproteobacteria bacterium]|nr:acylphosphatase [Rhodospirillaceae bacterium]MDE0063918.1 acylphosphatase [Gammaproteobacteria bacterium]MDE0361061.1 acylphosphatase [Rhodospirillaceae bacterium]